jgi:hypothetical protein
LEHMEINLIYWDMKITKTIWEGSTFKYMENNPKTAIIQNKESDNQILELHLWSSIWLDTE